MTNVRRYPAKIMLAGEYGVVVGGEALTIPFPAYGAKLRRVEQQADPDLGPEASIRHSQRHLEALCRNLAELPPGSFHAEPDLELLSALHKEYWLDSDIPVGVGLGSSGAVSAAVYDLCFQEARRLSLQQQKDDLARIEGFFHGTSSGVDALTCFAGRPIRHLAEGMVQEVEIPWLRTGRTASSSTPAGDDPLAQVPDAGSHEASAAFRFFLLDSGERSDTHSRVSQFLSQMRQQAFADQIRRQYLPRNTRLITAMLEERSDDPVAWMGEISEFQFRVFRRMIPGSMIGPWEKGLSDGSFYLKLNGSGGGFVLGVVRADQGRSLREAWGGEPIWVS